MYYFHFFPIELMAFSSIIKNPALSFLFVKPLNTKRMQLSLTFSFFILINKKTPQKHFKSLDTAFKML